jgi:ECF sigma factor
MTEEIEESQEKVTQMLRQVQAGNREALDELFPIIYKELRQSYSAADCPCPRSLYAPD